jgi:FkbM family methyltransferase
VTPWLLRLPGLRRYGAQLLHARNQLTTTIDKLDGLRKRLRVDRDRFARIVGRHKARQLEPKVLRHVLRARHAALLASAPDDVTAARLGDFLQRSHSYGRAKDTQLEIAVSRGTVEGLTWCVPADGAAPGGLADRIVNEQWLPFHDILAARELAVGRAMIDVGANVGTTSIPRVVLGDFEYVHAAEPDPANYACLVENVRANGLEGRVLPDCVAIGASDAQAILRRGAQIGTHHLVMAAARPDDVAVRAMRLDSWVAAMGIDVTAVTFVKVDTQGWESQVLAGAPALLALPHVAWQIEFSPSLLKRSGASADVLLAQIERYFTHFIDLGGSATPRARQVGALRESVAYVERRERRYTNLLLYHGDTTG